MTEAPQSCRRWWVVLATCSLDALDYDDRGVDVLAVYNTQREAEEYLQRYRAAYDAALREWDDWDDLDADWSAAHDHKRAELCEKYGVADLTPETKFIAKEVDQTNPQPPAGKDG